MGEMSQGLTRLGLDPAAGDGINLKRLWALYQEKEAELHRAEENQKKEMKVEKYIENIRKVSEERDSLMEELEAENEALKDEVRQLREELNRRKKEGTEVHKQEHKIQIAKLTELEKAGHDIKEKEKIIKKI